MMIARKAAMILRSGGIIGYPTEGVYGLGCLPDDLTAVRRLLRLKQRDPAKGLILIAANSSQFGGWIDTARSNLLPAAEPDQPITWIVPPADSVAPLIRGEHSGIAVRITSNPVARAVCEAVRSPVVSTSANFSGRPVARNQFVLRRQFHSLVDYLVPGDCGPSSGPSEIRILETGQVLRPRHPRERL